MCIRDRIRDLLGPHLIQTNNYSINYLSQLSYYTSITIINNNINYFSRLTLAPPELCTLSLVLNLMKAIVDKAKALINAEQDANTKNSKTSILLSHEKSDSIA